MFDYTSLDDDKLLKTYEKLLISEPDLFITELFAFKTKKEVIETELRKRRLLK